MNWRRGGDEVNGIQAEAGFSRMGSTERTWPEGLTAGSWLHKTALRLYPDSKDAKEHNTEAPTKPPKISPRTHPSFGKHVNCCSSAALSNRWLTIRRLLPRRRPVQRAAPCQLLSSQL
jgi:hypothetical protein